ncbi:hypothetical protein ACJMK2_043398 [Sinanodonta woodiana]|uniref:KY-like immunoglobulin-like domain-containing protein n=1 Tax=Sinanodonta woodiana TaxID=1069815 RepID=A0ABD3VWS0_SINWO
MGCNSSKVDETAAVFSSPPPPSPVSLLDLETIDLLQEPTPEDHEIYVSPHEDGYPKPVPAKGKRDDIYKKEDFAEIDERARNATDEHAKSYEYLLEYLTSGLDTNLKKLRAIFIWMGSQSFMSRKIPGNVNIDTPLGYIRLIQKRKGSYSSLLALLCRKVGMPCMILSGIAKSLHYQVGMDDDKCSSLRNTWNAVFVEGGWRLVFPLWAFLGVGTYRDGHYVIQGGEPSRQEKTLGKQQIEEFFFLTDPEQFVYFALPDKQEWQFLKKPWSVKKFADVPLCRPAFFKYAVQVDSSGRVHTKHGECNFTLRSREGIYFSYMLYYDLAEPAEHGLKHLQLMKNFYILPLRQNNHWVYLIRLADIGVYKLIIFASSSRGGHAQGVCEFKLFCDEAKKNCIPYPVNPEIGFGVCNDTEKSGLSTKYQKEGIVYLATQSRTSFTFTMLKSVSVYTRLIYIGASKQVAELKDHVSVDEAFTKRTLSLDVKVPGEEGEYVLQLYAKEEGNQTANDNSAEEKQYNEENNICNYLLVAEGRKGRLYENAEEKKIRQSLREKEKAHDIVGLEEAIRKFKEKDLDNRGDLTRASEALEFLKVQRELRVAIIRRHMDPLQKAIPLGRAYKHPSQKIQEKIKRFLETAEEMCDHLIQLGKIAHDVSQLSQSATEELRTYLTPPDVVPKVMLATYLLLGENESDIENWEDLRTLMRRTGKQSLMYRVEHFDIASVQPVTLARVRRLIMEHNELSARLASPVAGTFFVWVTKVLSLSRGDVDIGETDDASED